MTYRLFEGRDHAAIYQKYRFMPPDEAKNIILQYLDKKVCHGPIYCGYKLNSVTTVAYSIYLLNKTGHYLVKEINNFQPLPSSEGTASCAGSGFGMWNRSEHPVTGTTLSGDGGHRYQSISTRGGQSCAGVSQYHIQVCVYEVL